MSWSRLIDTPYGQSARERYMRDPYRRYHTWGHVLRLYHHAEFTLKLDYDADLDEAILVHDIIFDAQGENERRSAEWMRQHNPASSAESCRMVMDTVTHSPRADDNRIIILDLLDISKPVLQTRNLNLLSEETCLMRGISPKQHLIGTEKYLAGLADRLSEENIAIAPRSDQPWLRKIRDGALTVRNIVLKNLEVGEKSFALS